MDIKPGEITDILKREIKDYDREIDVAETGTVLNAGDGIARVYGLDNALAGELVEFDGGLRGMVLNLEEDNVGVAIMGSGLAAAGIAHFRKMLHHVEETAPLRRTITQKEVGNVAAFLCSDLASGITGDVLYVDSGYHILGMA